MSSAPDLTRRVLRHERVLLVLGIVLLVGLSWAFLVTGAGMRASMDTSAMRPAFAPLVLMWWVMMAAMMLPSASPALLLYGRVREARSGDSSVAATWLFLSGYLAMWLLFSLIAASAQTLLGEGAMAFTGRYAQAVLLIAAGAYQLSPLKAACLGECRSPAQFITRHWRAGPLGAVRLGLLHGAYCVGCCWMLMALLFVGGVMNLWWVVALTVVVAIEKLVKGGLWLARCTGVALLCWGVVRLLS